MEVLKGMAQIKCSRERGLAIECWKLLHEGKFTDVASRHFNDDDNVEVYFNTQSGNVFLSDGDMNTTMENEGELDLWINLGNSGVEGFLDDLIEMLKDGELDNEDYEELYGYLDDNQKEELKDIFIEAKL